MEIARRSGRGGRRRPLRRDAGSCGRRATRRVVGHAFARPHSAGSTAGPAGRTPRAGPFSRCWCAVRAPSGSVRRGPFASQVPDSVAAARPLPCPAVETCSGFTALEAPADDPDFPALDDPSTEPAASLPAAQRRWRQWSTAACARRGSGTAIVESAVSAATAAVARRRPASPNSTGSSGSRRPRGSGNRRCCGSSATRATSLSPRLCAAVIDRSRLAAAATWGEWLDRFGELARWCCEDRTRPAGAGGARAMGAIGPVSPRKSGTFSPNGAHDRSTAAAPRGAVFVAGPHRPAVAPPRSLRTRPRGADVPTEAARRSDAAGTRRAAAARCRASLQEDRARRRRSALRLAIGAATDAFWPRIAHGCRGRPRPRAVFTYTTHARITAPIPNHEVCSGSAGTGGANRLAGPGASLRCDRRRRARICPRAGYHRFPGDRRRVQRSRTTSCGLNDAMRRSVTVRWARGGRAGCRRTAWCA